MEPKPNPDKRVSTANSTEVGEFVDRVVEFLAEAPSILAYVWNAYRRPIVNVAILLTLLASIVAIFDFLESVNELVFFPTLFTVLGLIQVARFVYSRVLFAKDRQKLLQEVGILKQEFLGPSSVAGLLDSTQAIEVTAIAVSEPAVLEAIVTPVNPVEPDVSVVVVPLEDPMPQTPIAPVAEPPVLEAELLPAEVVAPAEVVEIEEKMASAQTSTEPDPVVETMSAPTPALVEENEISSEDETVLEPEQPAIVKVEVSVSDPTTGETKTVQVVSESASEPPQEPASSETPDPSEATSEESTADKPLGFETKTPKKGKKKSVTKVAIPATDKAKMTEIAVTVDRTQRETVTPENSEASDSSSSSLDDLLFSTNGVDELRYLLLSSQVELLDSPEQLQGITYTQQSETFGIGVVTAEGEKCERCWNYSTSVGRSSSHPSLCHRCIAALSDRF